MPAASEAPSEWMGRENMPSARSMRRTTDRIRKIVSASVYDEDRRLEDIRGCRTPLAINDGRENAIGLAERAPTKKKKSPLCFFVLVLNKRTRRGAEGSHGLEFWPRFGDEGETVSSALNKSSSDRVAASRRPQYLRGMAMLLGFHFKWGPG